MLQASQSIMKLMVMASMYENNLFGAVAMAMAMGMRTVYPHPNLLHIFGRCQSGVASKPEGWLELSPTD